MRPGDGSRHCVPLQGEVARPHALPDPGPSPVTLLRGPSFNPSLGLWGSQRPWGRGVGCPNRHGGGAWLRFSPVGGAGGGPGPVRLLLCPMAPSGARRRWAWGAQRRWVSPLRPRLRPAPWLGTCLHPAWKSHPSCRCGHTCVPIEPADPVLLWSCAPLPPPPGSWVLTWGTHPGLGSPSSGRVPRLP